MSDIKKYEYIDTMRGIAILLVVLCHCAWYLYEFQYRNFVIVNLFTRGQIGVQLFFVASALTLCLSMDNRGNSNRDLPNFYLRRFFRIAPLYYLGIGLYFFLNYFFVNRYNPHNIDSYTVQGILCNVFFINGFVPKYNNTIVPGGWSIGTEMVFYLCFPFLFRWLRAKSFKYILSLIVIYSLVVFLIIVWRERALGRPVIFNDTFYYFNFFNQFPVFLFGILLYKQIKDNVIKSPLVKALIAISGLVLFYYFWNKLFFAAYFLVPLFAGGGMFGLGCLLQHYNKGFGIISKIGQLSYSIYLFHFIITHYAFPVIYERYLIPYVHNGTVALLLCFVITLVPIYVIALITKKHIEEPFISIGNRVINNVNNKLPVPKSA